MNQELANRLSASFYRQMFYMRMMLIEQDYFLKQATHSGIKNVLSRIKESNYKALDQLNAYMPNSRAKVSQIMNESEEKIHAMANIIERLSVLDEETLLALEDNFEQHIKVVY